MALCSRTILLSAALIGAAISPFTSSASEDGYWTCTQGQWSAVGKPQHPQPLKICGAEQVIPRTEDGCKALGGKWGPAGIFPQPICRVPTRDGGRACSDTDECEGECLAKLSSGQRTKITNRQKLRIDGVCTPYIPVFGCAAIVNKGYVTSILCRD